MKDKVIRWTQVFLMGVAIVVLWGFGAWSMGDRPDAGPDFGWRTIAVDMGVLEYAMKGEGTPLVVLPGAAGMDVRVYKHILYPLEEHFRVIYVNPRLPETTDELKQMDYGLETLAADLEQLRRSLEETEWYILGHGYGAQLALQYALEHSENMAGLILTGGAHYLGDEWFFQREDATKRHPAYEEYTELPTLEHNSDDGILMLDFFDGEGNQELVEWLQPYLDVCLEANAYFMEQCWTDFDLRGQLTNVTTPTLLLWGKYDVVDPLERAEELAQELPDARLVVLEEGAFWAILEQRDAFIESVLEFTGKR